MAHSTSSGGVSDLYRPFTAEKLRGMVMSLVASVASNGLNIFGQSILGMSPLVSTTIFLQVFGNLLVYVLDILFAKEIINGERVSYLDAGTRLRWMLKSFFKSTFLKYIITILIDSIILVEMLDFGIFVCEKNGIRFKFRNEIIAGLISIVTFILWVNALRFNWAYAETENATLNIIIIAWLGISITVFCATRTMRSWMERPKESTPPDSNNPMRSTPEQNQNQNQDQNPSQNQKEQQEVQQQAAEKQFNNFAETLAALLQVHH
jgi:hypothetical protein